MTDKVVSVFVVNPKPVASGKVGQMQDKIRWWVEEGARRLERGEDALAIFRDLVDRDKGLLYHAERRAKELGL